MNKLFVTGNLTNNPELRTTATGKSVCNFSVAVNRKGKKENEQETDYFRVSAWNQLGEICSKYLSKGKKVAVIGSVSLSTYETQNGKHGANMDVLASDVEFLSQRSDNIDKESGYEKVDVEDLF